MGNAYDLHDGRNSCDYRKGGEVMFYKKCDFCGEMCGENSDEYENFGDVRIDIPPLTPMSFDVCESCAVNLIKKLKQEENTDNG